MEGCDLCLRPLREDDGPFLFRWRGDGSRLREWNSGRFCPTYETFLSQLATITKRGRIYICEPEANATPCGLVHFDQPNPIADWLFASVLVVPAMENVEIVEAVIRLASERAKTDLGICRTLWEPFGTDECTREVLLSLGAKELGYIPDAFWFDGGYVGRWKLSLRL